MFVLIWDEQQLAEEVEGWAAAEEASVTLVLVADAAATAELAN